MWLDQKDQKFPPPNSSPASFSEPVCSNLCGFRFISADKLGIGKGDLIAWVFLEGSGTLWRAGLETGVLPAASAYSGQALLSLALAAGWEGRRATECWRTPGS